MSAQTQTHTKAKQAARNRLFAEQFEHQTPQEECRTCPDVQRAAAAVETMGYRKVKVLGYVVVDRAGTFVGNQHKHRESAQALADEWTADAKKSSLDWDYRVAEIVEAAA